MHVMRQFAAVTDPRWSVDGEIVVCEDHVGKERLVVHGDLNVPASPCEVSTDGYIELVHEPAVTVE